MAQSTRQSGTRRRSASKSTSSGKSTRRSAAKSSASRRPKSSTGRKRQRQSTAKASPVKKVTAAVETATRKVGRPAMAGGAAIAVAGGALLSRQMTRKRGGVSLKPVTQGISSAGKRVAKTSQHLAKR